MVRLLVLLDRFFDVLELALAEKDIGRHLAGVGLRRRAEPDWACSRAGLAAALPALQLGRSPGPGPPPGQARKALKSCPHSSPPSEGLAARSTGRAAILRAVAPLYHVRSQATANHYQNAEYADRDLHRDSGRDLDLDEMGRKRQEHPEAEDFQRMLAAQDRRPQPGRFQRRPVARHEIHGDRRERQEMREAQHVEIGLVDRIDLFARPSAAPAAPAAGSARSA